MELYLDTSDVVAVKALSRIFPLAGVTTNPSIIAAGKKPLDVVLPQLHEAMGGQGRLFAQVMATTAEGMVNDALKLRSIIADVVISSGGVSVGEADYTKTILEELGEIAFWKLAIKPGKPFAFGKLSNSWFCGLPGNPVSATLTFYQLVQPLLAKLSGNTASGLPARQRVRTASRLKKTPGRLDFQRGVLQRNADGELEVTTTGHQGSHIFSSFSLGNCFIVLERDRGNVEVGEWVEVEPFNALFGGL